MGVCMCVCVAVSSGGSCVGLQQEAGRVQVCSLTVLGGDAAKNARTGWVIKILRQ